MKCLSVSQRLLLWIFQRPCHHDSAEYIRKVHLMEHWNASDSSLRGELSRSYFALMVDKKPLVKKSQSDPQHLHILPYHDLSNKLSDYGLKVDLNCCALLDAFKKDQYDFVPLMGLSLQIMEIPDDSPISVDILLNKLACALGGNFTDLKLALLTFPLEKDRNLVAKMQSLLKWNHNFRYCPRCATRLKMRISKTAAFCVSCKETYYPPLSPVAACLVTNPDDTKTLLVRRRGFKNNVYSIISGFAQIGESFEETVRREVAEEVGIECRGISSIKASTSWPIPYGSLMCGFLALADSNEKPVINVDEIEAASWFSRAEVAKAFEHAKLNFLREDERASFNKDISQLLVIPPRGSIAFQLIERWLKSER